MQKNDDVSPSTMVNPVVESGAGSLIRWYQPSFILEAHHLDPRWLSLLDEVTGEYDILLIRKVLLCIPLQPINFCRHEQDLIVVKGNQKNIRSFEEMVANKVSY